MKPIDVAKHLRDHEILKVKGTGVLDDRYLLESNNLSDLANATTARTNLGLGTGDSPTFTDLTLSTPSNIYALSHDSFADFIAAEHFTEASIDHTAIQNIGTNTHAQIDTFIGTTVPTTYLKLDTSNDPLTGNLEISKADPESRLTDIGDSEYTRVTRTDASGKAVRYNRTGKPGVTSPALSFDGGDYASATDHVSLDIAGTISISTWVKRSSAGSNDVILCKGGPVADAININYEFRFEDNNKVRFIYIDNVAGVHVWESTNAFTSTAFQHLAVTFTFGTGASILLRVNDTAEAGAWVAGNGNVLPTQNAYALVLGSRLSTAAHNFNGIIEETAIWSRILALSDITDLYVAGVGLRIDKDEDFPTSETSQGLSLEGLWHFDEDTGTDALDESANSNTFAFAAGGAAPSWGTGHVLTPISDTEVLVWSSEDGVVSAEEGIQTFGDDDGRTVIQGEDIYIASGTTKKVGFYNETPVVQQAYTSVSDPPTQAEVEAIRDALVNLGLMASS